MQTKYQINKSQRTGIITLTMGLSFCGKEALEIRKVLENLLKEGNRFVYINAENVENTDLTGINVLAGMLKKFRDNKGELFLTCRNKSSMNEWLHLTKFGKLFQSINDNLI